MRCIALAAVVVAGCGRPADHAVQEPRARPAPTPPAVAPASTLVTHAPGLVATAPHAAQIRTLAATPEGDAILSIDELDGVRLWTTLDGTQEPRIVELSHHAREVALGHHGDGYLAATRDEGGGLYLAQLDRDGRTRGHTTFGVDPPFTGIDMTARGLLAWRSDQHILLVTANGTVAGDLATEPQQRIVDIAVRGSKAIALLELTGGLRKARWLTLEPSLAWGAWIDHGARDANAIALAPGHGAFAYVTRAEPQEIVVVDIASRKVTKRSQVPAGDVLFIADDLLVAASPIGPYWLRVTPAGVATPFKEQIGASRQQLAVAGDRIVMAYAGDLMLGTPTETKYLGYAALSPQVTAPGAKGQLLMVLGTAAWLVDAQLRQVSRATLPEGAAAYGTLAWVEGTQWLVEHPHANKVAVSLVDIASGTTTHVRTGLTHTHRLDYEPSTGHASLSLGPRAEVAKLDLAGRTLDGIVPTPKLDSFEEVVFAPLDPSLARGHQLVRVDLLEKTRVQWFKTPTGKPTATLTIPGAYMTTDAAGRVYAWRLSSDGEGIGIYADGKEVGSLPTEGPATLWPDPTARFVAETGPAGVAVYTTAGTLLWRRPFTGVHEAQWLTDGSLVLVHASGLAKLDVQTGALVTSRCGWQLELSDTPHAAAPSIEPICAQLSH